MDSVEENSGVSYSVESLELLAQMYTSVDMFDNIMETLENLLDDSIRLYEELENLIIYREQLKNNLITDVQNIDSEIERVDTEILNYKEILENTIGNAGDIANNISELI